MKPPLFPKIDSPMSGGITTMAGGFSNFSASSSKRAIADSIFSSIVMTDLWQLQKRMPERLSPHGVLLRPQQPPLSFPPPPIPSQRAILPHHPMARHHH